MKKTVGFIAICICVFSNSFAQVRIGPFVGMNISNGTSDNSSLKPTSILRGCVGAIATYNLIPNIGIESGLLISLKGYSYEESFYYLGTSTVNGERKLTYLAVPFNISYSKYFTKFRAGVYLGPELSIMAVDNESITSDNSSSNSNGIALPKESYLKAPVLDFGFTIGMKVESNKGMGLKIQLCRGFINTWDDPNQYSGFGTPNFKSYNKVVTLGAYYLFGNEVD